MEHGGVGTPHSRGASGKALGASADKASFFSWRLRVAGRAVRRLGDSAPRWPAGSPAQWQRPRMKICVGPRDPDTKPSWGRLCVVVRKPRLVSAEIRVTWNNKVTAKARAYWRGCTAAERRARAWLGSTASSPPSLRVSSLPIYRSKDQALTLPMVPHRRCDGQTQTVPTRF